MYLVFLRQVVVLIPLLLLAARLGRLDQIWPAFSIAEAISIPFGRMLYKRIHSGCTITAGGKEAAI